MGVTVNFQVHHSLKSVNMEHKSHGIDLLLYENHESLASSLLQFSPSQLRSEAPTITPQKDYPGLSLKALSIMKKICTAIHATF